jgi:hypothetical protein
MFLVDDVSNTGLFAVVIMELVKKLFFVGLINDVTKVGLEWIVCAKDQV